MTVLATYGFADGLSIVCTLDESAAPIARRATFELRRDGARVSYLDAAQVAAMVAMRAAERQPD